MIVVDAAGVIASFSAAAERLFGYAEADVLGRNVAMLVPEQDRHRTAGGLLWHLVDHADDVTGSGRGAIGLRRDGTIFPIELAVGETLSGGQRLFTAFIRDLTERHRNERRVQTLQAELIEVTRLSAMGTLASTLAHELNQPLTAITNYLEATHEMLGHPTPATVELVRNDLPIGSSPRWPRHGAAFQKPDSCSSPPGTAPPRRPRRPRHQRRGG